MRRNCLLFFGAARCAVLAAGATFRDYLVHQQSVLSRMNTSCAYKKFMLKHDSNSCSNSCVKPLFVTGCGGSGTHFIWSFLSSMKILGEVTHEAPSVLKNWASRDGRALRKQSGNYERFGAAHMLLRAPMVSWAQQQSKSPCVYRTVAHVVRHPLKVFASSVAFGQCVECWIHIEEFVIPPFFLPSNNGTDLAKRTRLSILANRRSKRNLPMGGRDWTNQSITSLIEGFAMYWLAWNVMIEPVADYRFQIETADYVKLCELSRVADLGACERAAKAAQSQSHKFQSGNHGGSALRVTWDLLNHIDAEISDEVWKMAQKLEEEYARICYLSLRRDIGPHTCEPN